MIQECENFKIFQLVCFAKKATTYILQITFQSVTAYSQNVHDTLMFLMHAKTTRYDILPTFL
jgi:hypothetical protein